MKKTVLAITAGCLLFAGQAAATGQSAARVGDDELVGQAQNGCPQKGSRPGATAAKKRHQQDQEAGVDVERVSIADKGTLTSRLVDAITKGTQAVFVSTIFFALWKRKLSNTILLWM